MGNNESTDADLVARVLSGDREAFGSLYDRYARLVRTVVFDVAKDWSTVQDLTQDCFLRAYQNLGRLRQPDRFGHWLVGIARQVARERRRTLRRDRHHFVGTDTLEMFVRVGRNRCAATRRGNRTCNATAGRTARAGAAGDPRVFPSTSAMCNRRPNCWAFRDPVSMRCWSGRGAIGLAD